MVRIILHLITFCVVSAVLAQGPAAGLLPATLDPEPMSALANPAYLDTAIDPAFGTTIRRISDAAVGERIVPMYSTVQAWNADESLLLLYEVGSGHRLLNGQDYSFIRMLGIQPLDVENVFWSHTDPNILYYPRYDASQNTTLYVEHNVATNTETTLVDLGAIAPACANGGVRFGNDVQMPSWDDDVIGFRCQSSGSYLHRISTGVTTQVNIPNNDLRFIAAMPSPSGNRAFHVQSSYDANSGNLLHVLNKEDKSEHACIGRWADGSDGYFAVAFAQGPQGGCIGQVIGHDLATGACYDLVAQSGGWPYPRTGTHISSLAHQAEDGWMAVSMIGNSSGAGLFDQELLLVRALKTGAEIYRIGHHRSDEQPVDYWGEPHAVISPSGTRVLFGSDWGAMGNTAAVNSYVVELPAFGGSTPLPVTLLSLSAKPTTDQRIEVAWQAGEEVGLKRYVLETISLTDLDYVEQTTVVASDRKYYRVETGQLPPGDYRVRLRLEDQDGSIDYSEELSVHLVGEKLAVRFVSIPGSTSFHLLFDDTLRPNQELRVYDLIGREVYRSPRAAEGVDASDWPAGSYIVTYGERVWPWVR